MPKVIGIVLLRTAIDIDQLLLRQTLPGAEPDHRSERRRGQHSANIKQSQQRHPPRAVRHGLSAPRSQINLA
jgi:hypothetical protein